MERSCSSYLLSGSNPYQKRAGSNRGLRPTSFDHARTKRAEKAIITVTTHSQSEAPVVRWPSAKLGLTWTGLTIVMKSG
jgi:hypothetical protein